MIKWIKSFFVDDWKLVWSKHGPINNSPKVSLFYKETTFFIMYSPLRNKYKLKNYNNYTENLCGPLWKEACDKLMELESSKNKNKSYNRV